MVPIRKQQFLRIFHQKVWTTRQSIYSYRNCQPQPSRNSPPLQETILRCRQELRAITMCSAITLDCGCDNSTIIVIGEMNCPITKFSGKFCLHKKTFQSLGRRGYQCSHCASGCQLRNILFKINQILFSCRLTEGCTLLKRVQNQFKICLGCVLSWQVLSQQRKIRIYWLLCKIYSWLWKVWSLVVCSQSSFHVTRARKDEKTDKTRFSFAKK